MKKLIFCLIVAFQYSSIIYSWEVRVIPVNRDPMTGKWNGLFGHDVQYGWGDFRQRCSDEKDVPSCIAQMLQKQIHGAYALSPEQVATIKAHTQLANGDHVYCVPVSYISVTHLHKKMEESHGRDLTKDKFVWIPMDEVLQHRTVVKVARGIPLSFVFDFDTRTIIREFWEKKLLPELNAADPKRPYQAPSSEIVKKQLAAKQKDADMKKTPLNVQVARRARAALKAKERLENQVVMVKGITAESKKEADRKRSRAARSSVFVG